MQYFRYKLIAPYGQLFSGIIRLPYNEVMSAISYLERDGSTTIFVKRLGNIFSFFLDIISFRPFKKLNRTFQAEFLNNVAMMLHTGMVLTTALKEASVGAENSDFEKDIADIVVNIQDGSSFSNAAEKYSYIFPKTVIHLIKLGEETGKLDMTIMEASKHLKRLQVIVSDTKQALLYPSFVFLTMGGGIVFWFYYVVPKIVSLFQEMDVVLPSITVFLIQISEFVQNNILAMLLGVFLGPVIFMFAYKNIRQVRKVTSAMSLQLPVTKSISSASALAFISEYLCLLINSGIDIIRSLDILKDSIKNEVYRERIDIVKAAIVNGEGISDSFNKAGIFPSFVVRMINVGEQSGTLTDQLTYIAEHYQNRLALLVSTIGKMIEPIVIVMAGAMFMVIVIGLFLPIYDLISTVSGR